VRLIVATVAVFVVLGLVTGGSLRALSADRIRWGLLAFAGVVAQFVVLGGTLGYVLLILSFVLLIVFALANVRLPGFALVVLGLTLNVAVIAANHGMPVSAAALRSSNQADTLPDLQLDRDGAKHILADGDTRLRFLGDVIPVGTPLNQVVSAGDVAAYLGVGWFVIGTMHRRRDVDESDAAVVQTESL
jgi:Family of unknown function (DUF5317)